MRKAVVLLCAVLSAGSVNVLACSCAVRETAWWDSTSPIIFRAKIVATSLTAEKKDGGEIVSARFKTMEAFRGDPSTIRSLRTISGTPYGTCGIPLLAGDEFIIHTDKDGWALECSGTKPYHAVHDESLIAKLREARDRK